jgi:hydroxymethylbilane synthase
VKRKIIIGSRGSDLALWQADFVQGQLKAIGVDSDITIIKTRGDKIQHLSFDKMEGKGFFTKEIEEALLNESIDLAVHSHKDLETTSPDGLVVAAVSEREDPSELLLIQKDATDLKLPFSLKAGAVVGSSSARRKSQLLSFRDDVTLKDLRGNVPTRIQKLRDGQYDAILLARAGVSRLNIDLSEFHVEILEPREYIPAPAQGVLGLQVRESDTEAVQILEKLNHKDVQEVISVERRVLNLFQGGCQLPLGVYCINEDDTYKVWACVADAWDAFPKRVYLESDTTVGLAEKVVAQLKAPFSASVFLSRDLKSTDYFKRVIENFGGTVKANSLTRFEPVAFDAVPKTDWIFFSSRNCVHHFFKQSPQIGAVKFGTIGGATAMALREYDQQSDFTGNLISTADIGKRFASEVGDSTVLFPQSTASYRTIQKQFESQANLHDLIVYDTVENETSEVPETDVVVLTSPSNAILYLRNRKITADQKVIVMGPSTAKVLEDAGITRYQMPWSSSMIALADLVMSN